MVLIRYFMFRPALARPDFTSFCVDLHLFTQRERAGEKDPVTVQCGNWKSNCLTVEGPDIDT